MEHDSLWDDGPPPEQPSSAWDLVDGEEQRRPALLLLVPGVVGVVLPLVILLSAPIYLLFYGILVIIAGHLWFVWELFHSRVSTYLWLMWGAIANIKFVHDHWDRARGPLITEALGILIALIGLFLI